MIRAVLLDFDGVILESAGIKTEAFRELAGEYPQEQASAFLSYHISHMGISRYVKFRYLAEVILQQEYTPAMEKKWGEQFEQIVFRKVLECPFVPGAEKFLMQNYNKLSLFIVSGTPEEEMRRIAGERKISAYFKGIYGSPAAKTEIVRRIKREYGFDNKEMIFVGDASTDKNAAADEALLFVGRNTPDNGELFRNIRYRVNDLTEIEHIISSRNQQEG